MRRLVALCCAVIFLDSIFFAALAPLLPDLKRDLGLSTAAAGALSGSYAAGVLLLALPGGWFAVRHGARRAVIIGLVGMACFSLVFGLAENIWLLDAARFLQGASGALLWAGAMSWVIVAGPRERRGTLVGMLVAAATIGELLGAPIGAIAHFASIEAVFGGIALLCALLIPVVLLFDAPPGTAIEAPRSILRAMRGSSLPVGLWMLASASLAFGVATVVAPLRLDELGGSALLIAAAFGAASITETIVGPLVGRFSDRVGRVGPYRAGALIAGVAVLALSLLGARDLVFIAVVLYAVGAGLAFTPAIAMTADAADAAGIAQGYASGASNFAFGGGQMLGAVGAGLTVSGDSYLLPALLTVAVLLSAAAIAGRSEPGATLET